MADLEALARDSFGISLRPAQLSALNSITARRDTLAVLPTGSGKSAIYQIGGLALGGLTMVISPLISLQRDQLTALSRRPRPGGGSIDVAVLNSTQNVADRASTMARLRSGELDFLMLGPEQLSNAETHRELTSSVRPITLIAVDEAHLVSEWGHDFRPEYLRLRATAEALGRPPLLALTATAAPPVQAEITRQLGMRTPHVVVSDFDRPNITLAVRRADLHSAEDEALVERTVEIVIAHETPALVYAMSHARCEEIAHRLVQLSLRAAAYHAGMSARERTEVQDAFFSGGLDVVVATSAFGMGIDKSDVRTVVHAGVPASVDEYYQEIGRAGRDGKLARAVLVYDPRSLRIPRLFAARSHIADKSVAAVTVSLTQAQQRSSIASLTKASGVARQTVERVVAELEELGLVSVDDDGVALLADGLARDAGEQVQDAGRRRLAILGSRIDSMRHYAETVNCRRVELLAYFGETLEPPCNKCDNDASSLPKPPRPASRQRPRPVAGLPQASTGTVAVGAQVSHRLWGTGTLLSEDEHELVVSFDSVGYRHLTPAALANGLLTLVPA